MCCRRDSTTGNAPLGYRLQGIGVNIEGSGSKYPDGPTSVSVAVHADSSGQPGAKLVDLISPTEYAAGHSFFEAPPGTYLRGGTSYVLVWGHLGGTVHRLRKTSSDSEDLPALVATSASRTCSIGAPTWTTCPRTQAAMQWKSRCTARATGRPWCTSPRRPPPPSAALPSYRA